MSRFVPISVRQPVPNDLVGNPVTVAGIGTGFEGVLALRVVDDNGAVVVESAIHAGGTGIWGTFAEEVHLPVLPGSAAGVVEVYEESAADGRPVNTVTVAVVFGDVLVAPQSYLGFSAHTVVAGETLSSIAREAYGDAAKWRSVFAANRDVLSDPNVITVGQVLRIPVGI